MNLKLLTPFVTAPLVVSSVVSSCGFTYAATIGSSIDFTGYAYGTSNQMDYIDPSVLPLEPSPNANGAFQVIDASGSFASALMFPSITGDIRDFAQGTSMGLITQNGPILDGSNISAFYLPDFLRLNVPGSVNFTFQLETGNRTVVLDPASDPADPVITGISATLTGTLTDLLNNEVQFATGTFTPSISGVRLSQFNQTEFLGPVPFNGSLQVVSKPSQAVPEPSSTAAFALLGAAVVGYTIKQRKKLNQAPLSTSANQKD